jgi:glycosyltransferase involved in cell wall biosynthesis
MKMKIVVPVYNAQNWIKDCVDSIASQQHKDFECVVINDCSTDKTGDVLNDLKLDERFKIRHNETNQGALANTASGFDALGSREEPESILAIVDGDDRLASPSSLSVVNKVYTKVPDCLLTYGNYVDWPSGAPGICERFPQEVVVNRAYRTYPKFVTSHLRTFKSKLWYQLGDAELVDPRTGKFFKVTGDMAFMMPLMELAGTRFVFIEQVLYLYNRVNPISDGYIREREQWEANQLIRRLPRREVFVEQ